MIGWFLLFTLLLAVSVFAALRAWNQAHTFYSTPETESAFLKNYSPQHVIEQFRCNEGSDLGSSRDGAAGKEFVTHAGGFDSFFAMRSDQRTPLLIALNDDAYKQLLRNGAQILNSGGDPQSGFQYDYKLGKSIGSLTISPLETPSPSPIHRTYSLPNGTADVRVHIEEREMWFPKEPAVPNADQLQKLHSLATGTLTY
ncbi:MAG: hypothetical protein WBQ72_19990 [Terriglobales bacterium]|jgi:hypothetical protein